MATKIGAFQGDLTPEDRLNALLRQCDEVELRPERVERLVRQFLQRHLPHAQVTRTDHRLSLTINGRTVHHTAKRRDRGRPDRAPRRPRPER